ncbi:Uncharacterized beta-barrel protein YwiB, DUF1934 family [Alkalibacterium putridalgicola]|jgi:uncharacterized beta-barrel protein YwiB (DUF1934 family)|uniref:Uncharacterized beta-barrel protein YwiB, DUF1934 family n=1 Tax=Alkalibacterium putridalgicola TaxID=426703 RepID=A0A1H7WT63_9LACT|nr:DUF1934 domain-containing protein [Alkalibacterium putridalgicola]GEK90135.1 hypothetical protein APU01nite_21740 [Alkalibacterium putridalgicola]SEM24750.1 Uncharacterized beta-barrel protein YwiB, DUF1934 family [Alkalibacterium putridalgicola]
MPSNELKNGLPAEIKMETSYVQNGETHHHSFEENGRVVYMNSSYYIRFEEAHELGTVPVTIKINPDGVVQLIRRGEQTTRFVFDSDQETESNYRTPAGIIPLTVTTDDIRVSYYDRPFAGRIWVDYSLSANQQKIGDYHIRLRFTT